MKKLSFILFFFSFSLYGWAQNPNTEPEVDRPLTRILFIFDGSQSMHGRWESGSKIAIAQKLIGKMLDSLNSIDDGQTFQLALRVYGHQKPVPPQDCNDTKLEVPFAWGNVPKIKKKLRSISPKGTTPIARSLSRADTDFPDCKNCRNIIILITDGIEACDEDPCIVSRALQKKGIILKPFVIGIGIDPNFTATFECVGNYYNAADEKTFENVLGLVISQALDNTTAQINLLDIYGKPTETNVPIALYNRTSGKLQESFVHTLNFKGNPDTVVLDPLITYNMTVFTLPPVTLDSIRVTPGTHTHIGVDAPQGSLELKVVNARGKAGLATIVRIHGSTNTLNVQTVNTVQNYLVGSYDIEILTLPRIYQSNVKIGQSKNTRIVIPPPGVVNLQGNKSGYGSIMVKMGNKTEWVADLNPNQTRQSFSLQPGQYMLVYRPKNSQQITYSKTKYFSVTSGSTTIVRLN